MLNSYTYAKNADGTEVVETKKSEEAPLKNCEESDFVKSRQEEEYYTSTIKREGLKLFCLSDEAKAMQVEGTIQSKKVLSEANSYFSIQVYRCNNATRPAGNKCASV